jgi:hypothetical protein
MYRPAGKTTLRLGLSMLLILALSACGGGGGRSAEEEAKAHEIPEFKSFEEEAAQRIPPGKYVSDEFRPTMSFRLDEGWTNWEPGMGPGGQPGEIVETRDSLSLFTYEEQNLARDAGGFSWVEFMVIRKVYRVISSYEVKAEPAPDDIADWLQNNPNLDAEKPEPVTVGGEKGVQFDAAASRIPQYYYGPSGGGCGLPCLPLVKGSGLDFSLFGRSKARFIVLENVKGETVTIAVSAPAAKFDEFWPKVQTVLKSIEWKVT